jgi:hypothetical protein
MRLALLILMTALAIGCEKAPQPVPVNEPELDGEVQIGALPPPPFDLDTYEGVVADIVTKLDNKSKALLRKTAKQDLIEFHLSWGMGIRNEYRFWSNEALVKSCSKQRGHDFYIHPDSASMIVMEGVWDMVNARR